MWLEQIAGLPNRNDLMREEGDDIIMMSSYMLLRLYANMLHNVPHRIYPHIRGSWEQRCVLAIKYEASNIGGRIIGADQCCLCERRPHLY